MIRPDVRRKIADADVKMLKATAKLIDLADQAQDSALRGKLLEIVKALQERLSTIAAAVNPDNAKSREGTLASVFSLSLLWEGPKREPGELTRIAEANRGIPRILGTLADLIDETQDQTLRSDLVVNAKILVDGSRAISNTILTSSAAA